MPRTLFLAHVTSPDAEITLLSALTKDKLFDLILQHIEATDPGAVDTAAPAQLEVEAYYAEAETDWSPRRLDISKLQIELASERILEELITHLRYSAQPSSDEVRALIDRADALGL